MKILSFEGNFWTTFCDLIKTKRLLFKVSYEHEIYVIPLNIAELTCFAGWWVKEICLQMRDDYALRSNAH